MPLTQKAISTSYERRYDVLKWSGDGFLGAGHF
jgi:hypothetical protein